MSQYMSMDTLKYLVFEVLKAENLSKLEHYQDYDKESFDITLDTTKSWADKVFYPYFKEMDETPARWEDGKIIVHPIVGQMMKEAGDNGWIGSIFPYEDGGMQLPHLIYIAASHIVEAANNSLPGYLGLTSGAANLIVTFGEQAIKDKFVPKMMSGDWGGTMCLTEPQAGSSLSDIVTSASKNEDGSYNITGQKIFISGGDHEYCENFVHLVLARIEGAPSGTKGISLFVVPKLREDENGELVSNDVITAADFQKMGQRGYCTTHLVFGENKNCKAWLVGAENHGLKYMFQMMNGARIDVGLTAASTATAAYYASLQYANERPQGRRILNGKKDISKEQSLIIKHPDVRRMLLLQKSVVEGSLAVLLQSAYYQDMAENGPEETKEFYHDLLEFLTPIAKTYPSEMGRVSISNGLQIFGGYGFCTDFPLEQYYRDVRIMALYEGTTGIQSLDLLGRKTTMKNGQALQFLTKEVLKTVEAAQTYDELKPYADQLQAKMTEAGEIIMHLLKFAMSGEHERFIMDATMYMEYMSTLVIGWQWLKMATVAKEALVTGNKVQKDEFYESKVHCMKFYFKYEMPKTNGLKETLLHTDVLTLLEENKAIFA